MSIKIKTTARAESASLAALLEETVPIGNARLVLTLCKSAFWRVAILKLVACSLLNMGYLLTFAAVKLQTRLQLNLLATVLLICALQKTLVQAFEPLLRKFSRVE